ncbi:DUF11 domain-containing protein, partial [Verrucomicrobia bacterium]|nr:DUF11 domain-containing protein [Verrucomicrobiota bacterium]
SNGSGIQIPLNQVELVGKAAPYPSEIVVTGLSGTIDSVTATLAGLSHFYAHDLDIVLVAPGGQKGVWLMSDAAGGSPLDNLTLTFDDNAASDIPVTAVTGSGSYKPFNYDANDTMPDLDGVTLGTTLAIFKGMDPNGTWRLYIYDDQNSDGGHLASGWNLQFSTIDAITAVADLGVSASVGSTNVVAGNNAIYSITVTNKGPSDALSVEVVNTLSADVLVQASSGDISRTEAPQLVTGQLGDIAAGSSKTWTLTLSPQAVGTLNDTITVSSSVTDSSSADNTTNVDIDVVSAMMGQSAAMNGGQFMFQVQGQIGRVYVIEASSNLTDWSPISTNLSLSEAIMVIDDKASGSKERFYRAVEQ